MKKEDLIKCGVLLYGEQYKTALAEDLKVTRRTVGRWTTGSEIPVNLANDIKTLIDKKILEMQEVKKTLN